MNVWFLVPVPSQMTCSFGLWVQQHEMTSCNCPGDKVQAQLQPGAALMKLLPLFGSLFSFLFCALV